MKEKKTKAPAKKQVSEIKGKIARVDLLLSTNRRDGTYGQLVIGALLRTINSDGKSRGAFAPLAEHLKDAPRPARATWAKWLKAWDFNKDCDRAIVAVNELATLLGVAVGDGVEEYASQGKRCARERAMAKKTAEKKSTRTETAIRAIQALSAEESIIALRQAAAQIAPDMRRDILLSLIEAMDKVEQRRGA